MNATVIEFYALADSIGSAAENDNFLFIRVYGLIFLVLGGIIIGGKGFKFGGAGINDFK